MVAFCVINHSMAGRCCLFTTRCVIPPLLTHEVYLKYNLISNLQIKQCQYYNIEIIEISPTLKKI